MPLPVVLGDGADHLFLVDTASNATVNWDFRERLSLRALGDHQVQLISGRIPFHGARLVATNLRKPRGIVPQVNFVAVGVVDHRAATIVLFNLVGVFAGLLTPSAD